MTDAERATLLKKYKRKGTKKLREADRWERILANTNGGKATPEQMKERAKRKGESA